jgi:flagellar protein FliO/FliZ
MDGQFAASIIKIIIFLPVVLLLAYLSLKLGGNKLMGMGNSKLIRIVEKVPVSNKAYLCVALINSKPYVISACEGKIEILMELPEETLDKIKKGEGSFKESLMLNLNQFLKRKDKP